MFSHLKQVPHGDVKIRHPSRKHICAGHIMCATCGIVCTEMCACVCVRGRVQNPHVHGLSKNRNPSRKHISKIYLMCDV